MSATPLWLVILTSAAVGAAISATMTVIGQALERRSRLREMLLKAAIDHSWRYRDHLIEVARETGQTIELYDPAFYAEVYFRGFLHLYRTGWLPDDLGSVAEARDKFAGKPPSKT